MAKLFSFMLIIIVVNGCAFESIKSDSEINDNTATLLPGEKIYINNCKLCHGKNGALGLSGASDLRNSKLDTAQVIYILENGRNAMASFKGILTDDEIYSVATYVQNLKKQN